MNISYDNTGKNRVPQLLLAIHGGREEEVLSLLAGGADVNMCDSDGITPLMAAAMEDQVEIAKILLDAGASIRKVNKWGLTAYDIALWHNCRAIAALLKKVENFNESEL